MQKYFSLIILGASALGFIWPRPGLLAAPYLLPMLMVIMTLSFLKINFRELKQVRNDWWRYFVLLLVIFVLPTLIVFVFKSWLSTDIFIGLMIAAAVPSAISVVAISDVLHGEPAKALVSTTLAFLVSPIVTPFLVWLFARATIHVDFFGMMWTIAKLIFIPLLIAEVGRFLTIDKHLHRAQEINTLLLVMLVWGVVAPARDTILAHGWQVLGAFGIVLLSLSLAVIFSIWFGRTKKEDITWSVVDTYKNFALSSVLAISMFGPIAALGPVAYSLADNIILLPLQWWANRKK